MLILNRVAGEFAGSVAYSELEANRVSLPENRNAADGCRGFKYVYLMRIIPVDNGKSRKSFGQA
jgi:hypothetical protein